ncbi:MAG TPA: alpha/beta hydrolase [Pyrinomonadaceae bacterium]|nr:alpha/beta hydrolase [Pyrinomonadaceae bacterium]
MKKRYWIAGAYGLAGAALAAKLLSRPHDVQWEEHRGELPHAEHSRFVEVEGVRVHYQEAGETNAPPVILIHGFCASTFVWSDVFLSIAAAGFRVVAPDLAGFGFSEKPRRGEYTIDAQARLIICLMVKLGIEQAALVGSSYGGAVASICALDYGERVERLVLVDAVINDAAKRQPLLQLAAAPLMGDVISPVLLSTYRLTRWRMRKVYGKDATRLLEDERMRAHHRPLRAASAHRAVIRTLRRWNASRIEREAHRIGQPTLLIWGEDDADIPLEHGQRMFESMPNARLIVFRRCGHLPQEEYPQEFTKLVTEFCGATGSRQEKLKLSAAAT